MFGMSFFSKSVFGRVLICGAGLMIALAVRPSMGQQVDSALAPLAAATEEYLDVLRDVGSAADSSGIRRHMAQLALVMPDAVERQITGGQLLAASEPSLPPGTGEQLIRWWRRQDPLPASPVNERLLEHVQRVQHAESHFASDDRLTGFDDRGDVYVKYGRPERARVVTFDDPEFVDKLYTFGLVINQSDFPDNVFWRYGHIDGTGNFLFLEQNGQYQIGNVSDLLPRALRSGFNAGKRGLLRSEIALAAMQTIYRQLAAEDPVFLNRFSAVDNYVSNKEGPGRLAERVLGEGFRREILDRDDETELQPGGSERPASEIIQSNITAAKLEDEQMAYQRALIMPQTFTEVHRALPVIPMAVRAARFLDDDGTTRTEVYWGSTPGALKQKELGEQFLLYMTAVSMGPDYVRRAVTTRAIQVIDLPPCGDAAIPAQEQELRGGAGMYHLALQWDLYRLVRDAGGQVVPGERLNVATAHVDSLTALDGSGRTLEMSDLKPVMVWSATEMIGESDPYPYMQVDTSTPLGLFFEIYNLRYDRDDYARYQVTYQIVPRSERYRAPTSVTTTHTTTRSMEEHEILLDLTDWEDAGPVAIRVIVRDFTANSSLTRSAEFELF